MGRLIKTKDYIYDENGFMIFTEHYLKKRKYYNKYSYFKFIFVHKKPF